MEEEILCEAYGFLCERLRGGAKVDADKMSRFRDKSENREVQVALVHCLQLGNGTKDVELFCDEVFEELPLGLRAHLVQHLLAQWQTVSARREKADLECKMQGLGKEDSSTLVSQFPLSEWKCGRMTPARCLEVIQANMQCGSLGRALGERMEQQGECAVALLLSRYRRPHSLSPPLTPPNPFPTLVLCEGGYSEGVPTQADSESQALQRMQWRSYNFSPRRAQQHEAEAEADASFTSLSAGEAGDSDPPPLAPAHGSKRDLVELEHMQLSFADLVPRPQLVYLTAEGHCTVGLDDAGENLFKENIRDC